MDSKKIAMFESDPIPVAVMKLSVPTVLSTLVMVLYNLADTYFVGLLKDSVQSSAVTLAAPVLLAFNAVNNLFAVGSASLMSRSLGKKDYETVKRTASFSFWCALFCSLLISLFCTVFRAPLLSLLGADAITAGATGDYLLWTVTCGAAPAILNVVLANMVRAEGASAHAGIGVMSGCILNIILDPFFVLPRFLGMGAAGAGLATFLSNTFACLYFFGYLLFKGKETCVSVSPRLFGFRKYIVKEVFGVGVPSSIQNLLNVTGSVILNNFTAAFGPDAVSAMGIAHKVNMLPMYICMGVSQGIMPLVSYNYTSGNRKRMKDAITFVTKITVVLALAMTAVLFVFSSGLIRAFMDSDPVVTYGGPLLRRMSIGVTFLAVDFLAVGVFQSIGKGSYSLIFAILRKVVLEIPAIILLNYLMPLYGMGYAAVVSEFVLAVAAILLLRRICAGKENEPLFH